MFARLYPLVLTALLFVLLLYFTEGARASALTSGETINSFLYNTCNKSKCIQIQAKKANVGQTNGSYSTGPGKMTVTRKGKKKIEEKIAANDFYIDTAQQSIVIRDITGQKFKSAIYDLKNNQFVFFDN
jgi:lipopolysaccharide export system protein LptA